MTEKTPAIGIEEMTVWEWAENDNDPPTQVHIVMRLNDRHMPAMVMRIKSKASLIQIIAALQEQGRNVFGDLDTPSQGDSKQ